MSGSDNNAAQAIQMWNDEAPDYNPGNPVASHFTQVVWKETTQVGCAVVACNMPEFANGATSNFYVVSFLALSLSISPADDLGTIVRVQPCRKRLPRQQFRQECPTLIDFRLSFVCISLLSISAVQNDFERLWQSLCCNIDRVARPRRN